MALCSLLHCHSGFIQQQRAAFVSPRPFLWWRGAKEQGLGRLHAAGQKGSSQALWESLDPHRKALGVDFGTVKCGLAVSVGGLAPRPLKVVYLRHAELLEEIRQTARAEGVEEIVVGMPGPENKSAQSKKCREFAERLADATFREGWRIWLTDEAFSSVEATSALQLSRGGKSRGAAGSGARTAVDAVAAALILESYFSGRGGAPKLVLPAKRLLEEAAAGGTSEGAADGAAAENLARMADAGSSGREQETGGDRIAARRAAPRTFLRPARPQKAAPLEEKASSAGGVTQRPDAGGALAPEGSEDTDAGATSGAVPSPVPRSPPPARALPRQGLSRGAAKPSRAETFTAMFESLGFGSGSGSSTGGAGAAGGEGKAAQTGQPEETHEDNTSPLGSVLPGRRADDQDPDFASSPAAAPAGES